MIEFSAHVSGDTLYFYANTHRFDTGAATDADSVPTYRIYIQENGTVVATGSMALLDSANTAGFYSEAVSLAGYDPGEYVCYISATVNSVVGTKSFPFTVGQGAGPVVVRTTIATLASQTSFTLTGGPADNNALNRMMIVVRDAVNVDQFCVGLISAYTGASKTVTLAADPGIFTMAAGDFVEVVAVPRQLPNAEAEAAGGLYTRGTGAGQINQQANGQIDVNLERLLNVAQSVTDLKDFADDGYDPATNKVQGVVLVDTVTTVTGGATAAAVAGVQADTDDIQTRLPAALVGGRMDSSVGAMAANVLTAAALAADAATEIADAVWASASRTLTSFGTLVADIWAAGSRTLTSFGTLTADVADKLLGRSLAGGADGGRTVRQALRLLRNLRQIVAGTLTVMQEDDVTPDWTATVTTTPGDPISKIDP